MVSQKQEIQYFKKENDSWFVQGDGIIAQYMPQSFSLSTSREAMKTIHTTKTAQ